jgi:predicted TIM-barrel fold metal-dependent hydrolase
MAGETDRCVVISTDGHCGASLYDYKPYLEKRFHDEFDVWAETFYDPWSELEESAPVDQRLGFAAFDTPLNWDSKARLLYTEGQGIAAEVLFPNTAPPFYPSNSITAPPPLDRKAYEHRFAGMRAHNRWLVDFCNDLPGRRAGFAQVLLEDLDSAIAEVTWAKKAGLKGVLLPSDHVTKLNNFYRPEYERFWAACADLDLPLHRHGIKATESIEVGGAASPLIGAFELGFFVHRVIAHLILSGVFERHPSLKLVITESTSAYDIRDYLAKLDYMAKSKTFVAGDPDMLSYLQREPSEYFRSNCFIAAPLDFLRTYRTGLPNLMWGADLPHAEGTSPYTREALRAVFADVPQTDIRTILTETAAKLYEFDLSALSTVAERVGPTMQEIVRPLTQEEAPSFPDQTRSQTFAEFSGVGGTTPSVDAGADS